MRQTPAKNDANLAETIEVELGPTQHPRATPGKYKIQKFRHKSNCYIGVVDELGNIVKARPILLALCEQLYPKFRQSRMYDPDISNQTLTTFVKTGLSIAQARAKT